MRCIVILATLSIAGCLCCPKASCAALVVLEVRDAQGMALNDFTVTATGEEGPVTVTCPDGARCAPGQVVLAMKAIDPLPVSVTAGALSFSGNVSPVAEEDYAACRICPMPVASVVVR